MRFQQSRARVECLRHLTALSIFFSLVVSTQAAPAPKKETLMSGSDSVGWSVAPSALYTSVRNTEGFLLGVKGGAVLNRRLILGAAGYKLVGTSRTTLGSVNSLGYGGAYAEWILHPERIFHGSISGLVGGGSADGNSALIFQPSINGIVNVSRSVHLGAEVGYRFTRLVPATTAGADFYSGVNIGVFIQFGEFGI